MHIKLEIPELFGHIDMSQVKPILLNNMSKFQIGTKTGHRPQEHLFTLKSVIALHSFMGSAIIVQLYDIANFSQQIGKLLVGLQCAFRMLYWQMKGLLNGKRYLESTHRSIRTTRVCQPSPSSLPPHIDVEAGFQSSKSTIAETGMGVTSRP